MLNKLKSLFSGSAAKIPDRPHLGKDGITYADGQPYPGEGNFEKGIPVFAVDDILNSKKVQVRIERLFRGMALTQEQFDSLVLPVIRNFIRHVHYLPASERHHHSHPTGLLEHSLEVAHFALNIARARIFGTGYTPRQRRDNEVRWQLAAMLAGLMHDVGKPYSDYSIVDNQNNQWNRAEPLSDWLEKNNAQRYFIRWALERHRAHESAAGVPFFSCMTPEMHSHLVLHDSHIRDELVRVVTNYSAKCQLAEIVRKADMSSVNKNLSTHSETKSESSSTPPGVYIFNTIKSLLVNGNWKINTPGPGGYVWNIQEQVVLIDLERGSKSFSAEVRRLGLVGVPQQIGSILQELSDRGYILPLVEEHGTSYFWEYEVTLPDGSPRTVKGVRLAYGETIFEDVPPTALVGKQILQPSADKQSNAQNGEGTISPQTQNTLSESEQEQEPSETQDRPRDFNNLMEDLEQIEGVFQPDLAGSGDEQEPEDSQEPEESDAVAVLSKALSEQLAKSNNQTSDSAPATQEESAQPSQTKAAESEPKEQVSDEEKTKDPLRVLAEDLKPERSSRSAPPKPTTSNAHGNLDLVPVASPAPPKKTDKTAPVDQAVGQSPEESLSPAQTKPKAKPRPKKKRQLSFQEEVEEQRIAIEREKKLRSPLNLSPDATRLHMAEEQIEKRDVGPQIDLQALAPSSEQPSTAAHEPAIAIQAQNPVLGPSSEPSEIHSYIKKQPAVAKIAPEKKARPKINIENEKKQQNKSSSEKKSLNEKLQAAMPEVPKTTVGELGRVIESVLRRDIPLGVTLEITDQHVSILPDVLASDIIQQLCASPDCDITTTGSLIITGPVFEKINASIQKAQAQAEHDSTVSANDPQDEVTKNVTVRDAPPKTFEPKYVPPTTEGIVEELLQQMRIGYGNLIETGYRVEGTTAIVNFDETMKLIAKKGSGISRARVIIALHGKKAPLVGKEIKLDIAEKSSEIRSA